MKKIFFATDLHASERCYLKFLNAAKFYDASTLILGGDLTGKLLVPLVDNGKGEYTANFLGQDWKVKQGAELEDLERRIRATGQYPYRTNDAGFTELTRNHSRLDEIFLEMMRNTLQRWLAMAEERLKGTGVTIYATGGNDDPFEISTIIKSSDFVINPEEEVCDIGEGHEMLSLGYANITPWNCPRDIPEEELSGKIEELTSQIKNPKTSIFNFHCPPVDSTIDTAIKLDASVTPPKPIVVGGQPVMFGAGSKSVRDAIERYAPLLGLHGHIHESRGTVKIGGTICLNPGSEYGEGILRGALIELDREKVKSVQFTSG